MWNGGTCYILGGGWSLARQFGVPENLIKKLENHTAPPSELSPYLEPLHDKHCIGINKAYQIGPWIDVVFFGDCNWYVPEREALAKFPGLKVTCCPRFGNRPPRDPEQIRYMEKDSKKNMGISEENGKVAWNKNSGAAAVSLAYHLGVKKIVLLGFDMKNGPKEVSHWFGAHGNPTAKKKIRSPYERHLPGFGTIAKDAKRLGLEIINASPDSAIDCFTKMPVTGLFTIGVPKVPVKQESPAVAKITPVKPVLSKPAPNPKDIGVGCMHKYDILPLFHQIHNPELYLEIGVDKGVSLRIAQQKAIGVDPAASIGGNVSQAEVHLLESDVFFAKDLLAGRKPDMVFIDGLHTFDQVLRDFRNVEKNSTKDTLVIFDDILPGHPGQTPRQLVPGAWTGDVWKIIPILKEHRPDLKITMLDSSPTGLMAVTGLNPKNKVLWDEALYDSLLEKWMDVEVPEYILKREGMDLRKDIEEAIRNLMPIPTLKILCHVNHYYDPEQVTGFAGGATTKDPSRIVKVKRALKALKSIPGCEVKVCGVKGKAFLPLDIECELDDPVWLPYESLNRMRGSVDQYNYFINIEDDILLGQDVLNNIIKFDNSGVRINQVLLPNRIEHSGTLWGCVDLEVMPGWTSHRKEQDGQLLKVAQNHHSGVLILSNEKFKAAAQMLDPEFREVWSGGPMASALAYWHSPFLLYRNSNPTKWNTVEHLDNWTFNEGAYYQPKKKIEPINTVKKLDGWNSVVTGLCITYNSKELIEKAYNSVRHFHPTMPIMIIDGSNRGDPCYAYCKSLKKHEFTDVIQTDYNIGHGNGMDKGLRLIKTKYALVFDSDIHMIKSPVMEMLAMMERDTFGVGWSFEIGYDGLEFGKTPELEEKGAVKYLHPYFHLLNVDNYKKYQPYVHHGAPGYLTMIDIYEKGLSNKILKDFPGLNGFTTYPFYPPWISLPSRFVNHKFAGTREINEAAGKPGIEGVWVQAGGSEIEVKIPYGLHGDLVGAYNKAMESASTDWVLLLDQDVFLCNPYWYEMCLDAINEVSSQVGLITCVCNPYYGPNFRNCTSEEVQRATIQIKSSNIEEHIQAGKKVYEKYGTKLEKITSYKVAGFFMLVRKSIWEDLQFKTIDTGVQGIDWNYCKRLLDKGYMIYRMSGLYVFHRRCMRKLNWKKEPAQLETITIPKRSFTDAIKHYMANPYPDFDYATYVDKHKVKAFVPSYIYRAKEHAYFTTPEEIDEFDFSTLPEKFVIKGTHGCGWWNIVENRDTFDQVKARTEMKGWLGQLYRADIEKQYAQLTPGVLIEEHLGDITTDYKFFMFHGKLEFIQTIMDSKINHEQAFYDADWNQLPCWRLTEKQNPAIVCPKPSHLQEMIWAAKQLTEKIGNPPFVRVDLYLVNEEPHFGEYTFTPSSGAGPFKPVEYEQKFGALLGEGAK